MRFFITLLLTAVMSHAEPAKDTIIAIQPLGEVQQVRLDIVKKGCVMRNAESSILTVDKESFVRRYKAKSGR